MEYDDMRIVLEKLSRDATRLEKVYERNPTGINEWKWRETRSLYQRQTDLAARMLRLRTLMNGVIWDWTENMVRRELNKNVRHVPFPQAVATLRLLLENDE